MRLFNSPLPLVDACQALAETRCLEAAKQLPAPLKRLATAIAASPASWEWKHFWVEAARLWIRQNQRTKKLKAGPWGTFHDDVFDEWNRSEHAQEFMKILGQNDNLKRASVTCLARLKNQLLHWANVHHGLSTPAVKGYRPQFDLAEFPTKSISRWIHLGTNRKIELKTWDVTHSLAHAQKIERALSLVKTHSPESFECFASLTRRIVPIKQKELVSYSLQTLPGHSFINLYHRDELDLLDDLLHENGHHYLNLHLILDDILREDPDQIYYSPWRRTLRPVRGIYHAHFTFFFALKLFHDLSKKLLAGELSWPKAVSNSMKQKILFRFIEEWHMLDYTAVDIARAHRRGQVKSAGWKIFKQVEEERMLMKPFLAEAFKAMDADGKEAIESLRIILRTQAKLTRS